MTSYEQGPADFSIPDNLEGFEEVVANQAFESLLSGMMRHSMNPYTVEFYTIDRPGVNRTRVMSRGFILGRYDGECVTGQRIIFNRLVQDETGEITLVVDDYVVNPWNRSVFRWRTNMECHPDKYGEPQPVIRSDSAPVILGDPKIPLVQSGTYYESVILPQKFNKQGDRTLSAIQDLENDLAQLSGPDDVLGFDFDTVK